MVGRIFGSNFDFFQSCFKIVWALFLVLKGPVLFGGGGRGGRGVFLGQILTFSRVVWELFRKYLGIV